MKTRHWITLAALAAASPAMAQDAPDPPAAQAVDAQQSPQGSVRGNDDALTCEQLTAESLALQTEMDEMSAEMQTVAVEQMRAARSARTTSSLSSVASMIPVIGGIIGQVGSIATQAQMGSQQDRMLELSERMMVRGGEIGQRMNRVEILRSARCGAGAPAYSAPDIRPDEIPATDR